MTCLSRLVPLAIVLLAGSGDTTGSPGRPADLNVLVRLIAASDGDPGVQLDLLRGTLEAVSARRRMPMPSAWPVVSASLAKSPNADMRDTATKLALVFGDPSAFAALRRLAVHAGMPARRRIDAIDTLARARDESLAPVLQGLLADPAVRAASLRGLAATEDEATPAMILKTYPALTPDEKADALGTLGARPAYALALLSAIERGAVPRADVTASTLQALAGHADPRVKAALAKVWGAVRTTPAEKAASIARLKSELPPEVVARGDRVRGRAVFARNCASCHQLFESGGKIGPELTGSQRTNLDYVLSNIVDPSASVGRDYQVNVFETTDGRVVSGIVKREDERGVTVQTATDLVVIPRPEIESRRATNESLMPEGLLSALGRDDLRDLVAYLSSPVQVAPPPDGGAR